jgi:hypothetical protein
MKGALTISKICKNLFKDIPLIVNKWRKIIQLFYIKKVFEKSLAQAKQII